MNIHKNARLTPRGREISISRLHRGEHPADLATSMGVSPAPSTNGAGATARRALPGCKTCQVIDAVLLSAEERRWVRVEEV